MSRAFVLGAGLAGLVAAERLSAAGREVVLLEASPKAGGRCRSYRDTRLGRVIDNGNHLVLSANHAVLDWAERIGGRKALQIGDAVYPFLDVSTGETWTISPGAGPLGALRSGARPPGVSLGALAGDMAKLLTCRSNRTVRQAIGLGPGWEPFWDPMTRAILNEAPEIGSAALLRATVLRSFAKGAAAARPVFAPQGLGPALIDPAIEVLARRDVVPRLRQPVQRLTGSTHLESIQVGDETYHLTPSDIAILAVPPRQAADLLPNNHFPEPGQAILNAHFLAPDSGLPPLLALVGGAAHWLFRRDDVVSVTVSAAEASEVGQMDRAAALDHLWQDVSAAIRSHGGPVPDVLPPARLLRERAATFDQSPAGVASRHGPQTHWPNLFLAGDHIDNGLPATLEGAVRSGETAADIALKSLSLKRETSD